MEKTIEPFENLCTFSRKLAIIAVVFHSNNSKIPYTNVLSILDYFITFDFVIFYFLFKIYQMGRKKVSLEKKIEAKTLLSIGLSQREVARVSKVSRKCVQGVANKVKGKLPLSNSPGQGRKKGSTLADDRNLVRIMKKDRTKTSQELSTDWKLSNNKQLCTRTVRNRLLAMGYKSYTVKRKPLTKAVTN